MLDGEVAADVADAESAIIRLNAEARALVDTEALGRILLRAEAVASSRIEGLVIGARRLLHAEAVRTVSGISSDVTAHEVLNNIDAMVHAVESIGSGDSITSDLLLELHRRLLRGGRLEEYGGHFREEQNWIGGSDYNPCSADFHRRHFTSVRQLQAEADAWLITYNHRRRNHSDYMRGRTPHQILDSHKRNKAARQPLTTGSICHLDSRSGSPRQLTTQSSAGTKSRYHEIR